MKLTEQSKKDFEKIWNEYWYKIKPVFERLTDDQAEEFVICSKFYCAMLKLHKTKQIRDKQNGNR